MMTPHTVATNEWYQVLHLRPKPSETLGPEPMESAINMARCDISPLLLSNMMYLIDLRSVTLKFGVQPCMDLRSDLVRNIWRIKSFLIHEHMMSMKTWEYSALLFWNRFMPEMYLKASNLDAPADRTCLSFNPDSWTALTASWKH